MSWVAHIGEDEHGDVHIRTNLRKADECLHEPILAALASHLGFTPEPMRKAVGPPDPRYPELTVLIDAARRDWQRWGQRLVEAVQELLEEGKLLPMNTQNEQALQALFRDHHVRLTMLFGGHPAGDRERYEQMVRDGLIAKDLPERSRTAIAYKLGAGLDMLKAHEVKREGLPPLEDVLRQALDLTLTEEEEAALDYARRRAAQYMRAPGVQATNHVERILTESELGTIRTTVARAVEERQSPAKLAEELRDAVNTPRLQNDMDRVARTELAFAHSWGAYQALKRQAGEAGESDPLVYKFVSPYACQDCQRIWGPMANPHTYRLSYIEQREAAGGNFRRKRRDWGPVIGPVHPNCTEGPLQYYDEDIVAHINEVVDDLIDIFGG